MEANNRIDIERITENSRKVSGLMTRCPITGAYCSHRSKIIHRKIKRHKENKVMIFMIMHYSPITDTIYEWLFKDMMKEEGVKFNFTDGDKKAEGDEEQGDKNEKSCGCGINTKTEPDCRQEGSADGREIFFVLDDGVGVSLVRADDFSSNSHIICESVCAKIQEADMIIADLSYGNPNVFYELGIAVALRKKILPICYINRYYEEEKGNNKSNIRGFQWKEFLMKYFSINRKESENDIKAYQTDDEELSRFPYDKTLSNKGETVGSRLIRLLNKSLGQLDTLMLYDLAGFKYAADDSRMNMRQCIDNYKDIVDKICDEMERPGDRVCFMYSYQRLEVVDKYLEGNIVKYSFGDICKLAINQGIHDIEGDGDSISFDDDAERLVKNYIYNCTVKMNLQYPVLVDHIVDRIFWKLDELYCKKEDTKNNFTYLDIMLANAANCNIAFMDFRTNSLQALFWLGVFHGSGRFAVPLRYENTRIKDEEEQQPIDVAGLWNAYYFSENSAEFRRRIRLVLDNIYEKRRNLKYYEKRLLLTGINSIASADENRARLYGKAGKEQEEFYKRKFWEVMLDDGDIDIYPSPYDHGTSNRISNWEYDAFSFIIDYISSLNHFHSIKLKNVILLKREQSEEKNNLRFLNNCISMGDREVNPFTAGLLEPYKKYLYRTGKCDTCTKKACAEEGCLIQNIQESKIDDNSIFKDRQSFISYRGFYDQENSKIQKFPTEEFLKNGTDKDIEKMKVILYGHLIMIRGKAEDRNRDLFSIALEGSSGPATLALAKILSSNGLEKDVENCNLFSKLEELLLRYYRDELKKRLMIDNKYTESVVLYLCSCLCNYFLPLIKSEKLEALKKRAWTFLHSTGNYQRMGQAEWNLDDLYKKLEDWIDWIDNHKCVEGIVEVEVKSSYYSDHQQDLRELEKIVLCPETVHVIYKNGDELMRCSLHHD